MWRFLNSILVSIIGFIHWLVFVKLTNWEKENMRQMGLESREEQNELLRQRLEGEFRHIQIGPEQEAEFLRRFPEAREALRHRMAMASSRESREHSPSGFDDNFGVF